MPKALVEPDYPRGTVLLRKRYDEELHKEFSQFPGVRYAGDIERGAWLVPVELQNAIGAVCRKYGESFTFTKGWGNAPVFDADFLRTDALPHQRDGVARVLKYGAQLLNYPTGTGKSATTLFAAEAADIQNLIIVCPAVVRTGWADQAARWLNKRDVRVIQSSKDLEKIPLDANAPGWVVTSYELLGRNAFLANARWQGLVVDESHYVKEARAHRSKVLYQLSEALPMTAFRVASTATPVALEPKDLWHQLAVLNPGVNGKQGRFGTWWQFVNRYSVVEHNGYGNDVRGLNPDYTAELRYRLAETVHTVTAEEVAEFMPPYSIETLRFKVRDAKLKELSKAWRQNKRDAGASEAVIRAAIEHKVLLASELAANSIEANSHVAILTYYHETADAIMAALRLNPDLASIPLVRIPSDGTPKKRLAAIDTALAKKRCIAVMTMRSVGEGINNLAAFQHAIFAELYPAQSAMLQAIGRFPRLGNKLASLITLLVIQGTIDDPIAAVLTRRTDAVNTLFKQGGAIDKMRDAISPAESEEAFLEGIVAAAMSMEED